MHFEMFGGAVLVGMMTGWLAGIAMKGGGYGLLWGIVFALSGSFVGSWIFQTLGAPVAGWGGTGIAALVGAALMITLQRARSGPRWSRMLRDVIRSKRGGGGNVRE